MRARRLTAVLFGAALVVSVAEACGSDSGSGPGSTPVDLTGNYVLDTLTFTGIPTASTGTLSFTADSFNADFHVVIPTITDTTLALAGNYVARHTSVADSIYLTGDSLPTTILGTFLRSAQLDTLHLDLVIPGLGSLNSIWLKQ